MWMEINFEGNARVCPVQLLDPTPNQSYISARNLPSVEHGGYGEVYDQFDLVYSPKLRQMRP